MWRVYCSHPYATIRYAVRCSLCRDICFALYSLPSKQVSCHLFFSSTGKSRQSQMFHLSVRSFHLFPQSEPCVASSGWLDGWWSDATLVQLRLKTCGDRNLIQISEARPGIMTPSQTQAFGSCSMKSFPCWLWISRLQVYRHRNFTVSAVVMFITLLYII